MGAITGWGLAVTPSQESVLSALRSALAVETPHGPIGGIPLAVRIDQGKEFLAAAVRVAAGALAIDVRAQPGYSRHLKGTIERTNESIEGLFGAELPGFLHGATDRAGKPIDPLAPVLPFEGLVQLFDQFVRRYNSERPHDGLGGRTPLQQWEADPTPLHPVPAERLRYLMLATVARVVTKRGVRLDGRVYNCAELCGYVGEAVEVRYLPHHDATVEVFIRGRHLGTAQLVDRLSADEVARLLEHRAREARWLSSVHREAARRRRVRYAAMTEPGSMRPLTAFVESDAISRAAEYVPSDRRLTGSRSLADAGPVPERMVRPRVVLGGGR